VRLNRRIAGGDVPATVFPSDNEWGVPTLLLECQAGVVDLPFTRWGRARRKDRMRGTWHMYTDDYRFGALVSRPQALLNSACVATVEPNFSVHAQTPRAEVLHRTYVKRWLARFWQSHGIRILVDLHVAEEHADINLLGVPPGWASFCTRGGGDVGRLEREHERAAAIAGGPLLFVVYGGGKATEALCRARGWLWFAEEADEVRKVGRPGLRLVG
jgi:hypothetical protein